MNREENTTHKGGHSYKIK